MIELIVFAIAMATTIFLLFHLLYMNSLIYTLYDFGLQFSYDWASRYYLMLRLAFVLLSIVVITSLSMVILHRRVLKAKTPTVERERYEQTLMKKIEQLRLELWKYKRKPSGVAGYILLLHGAIAIASSVFYTSSILALIGLGLTFWGVLLLFVRPVRYVKSSLLDSTSFSSLVNMDRVIADLNYEGKGVYLPPRYLKGLKEGTVFISSSKKDITVPTLEEVNKEEVFLKNPAGILLTPSGLDLANLFETELGTDFAKVDLNYLQDNLPKLFIEGLEIAKDFEINVHDNMIHVKITEPVYKEFCNHVRTKLSNVCNSFGCPLCSSIACALARSSGEPVVIEEIKPSTNGEVIEAYYRILGTFPSEEQTVVASIEAPSTEVSLPPPKTVASAEISAEEVPPAPIQPTRRHLSSLLRNLVGFVLAALGLYTLTWVGWLTWYDITTWSKSLALILFGSRTREAISLGIGMKVIHYFLISLVLLLVGIFTLFRKRRRLPNSR